MERTLKIGAVIFDWAGTTVDFGCCGPVAAVRAAFERFGIELNEADARRPMGLLKRDHIAAIIGYPNISGAWTNLRGTAPGELEIDQIHNVFVELQTGSLHEQGDVIPGVVEAVEGLRSRNIRIGSTTGYTRTMLAPIAESAATQGYRPDFSVTPDEVGKGRPAPFMILENLIRLGVWPPASVVKVGDTPIDVKEGLNAGVWTVGVAGTGNGIGMPLAEFSNLPEAVQQQMLREARHQLHGSGAHFVIDSMTELHGVIDQIESLDAPSQASIPSLLPHLEETWV